MTATYAYDLKWTWKCMYGGVCVRARCQTQRKTTSQMVSHTHTPTQAQKIIFFYMILEFALFLSTALVATSRSVTTEKHLSNFGSFPGRPRSLTLRLFSACISFHFEMLITSIDSFIFICQAIFEFQEFGGMFDVEIHWKRTYARQMEMRWDERARARRWGTEWIWSASAEVYLHALNTFATHS